jgi:hypothetical protein
MRKRYPLGRGGAFWAPAAAELPGRLPGGRPRRRGLPGMASAIVHAFRWLTATFSSLDPTWSVKERPLRQMTRLQVADGDNLLSGPNLECEGVTAAADDGSRGRRTAAGAV